MPAQIPKPLGLAGQWIGEITGTNNGWLRIDIDKDLPPLAEFYVDRDGMVPLAASAPIQPSTGGFTFKLSNFRTRNLPTEDQGLPESGSGTAVLNESGIELSGSWETNIGTQGSFKTHRSNPLHSQDPDHCFSWEKFREWAFQHIAPSNLYRGHRSSRHWLQTSFHRTGRNRLGRYWLEELPELRRRVEAALRAEFAASDPDAMGSLLAIAQHHGFPTPLLDWTKSPFIAAYFALAYGPEHSAGEGDFARIYVFDQTGWKWGKNPVFPDDPAICISPLELPARHNPRLLPQQSVLMYSNVSDIEKFVQLSDSHDQLPQSRITRIDIPVTERQHAAADLRQMGITTATMFPELEGACRSLAEERFDLYFGLH